MQKVTFGLAAVLLAVIFFNSIAVIILYFSKEKENKWVAHIENQHIQNFEIIKFNASIYSFMDDTDLETVNKNIEIDHKIYFVFKKQIKNNVLILYYLPHKNISKNTLNLAKIIDKADDFEKIPIKKGLEKIYKNFDKDYLKYALYENDLLQNFDVKTANAITLLQSQTSDGFLTKEFAPPRKV